MVRERVTRGLGGLYIALQVFMHTPNAMVPGKTAVEQMWRPMWLARYSNTSPLFTSSVCFMVSLCIFFLLATRSAVILHRYSCVREWLLRLFAVTYLAKTALIVFPEMCQSATHAQLHSPGWLLRYSSTWPLTMTAVGLMVTPTPVFCFPPPPPHPLQLALSAPSGIWSRPSVLALYACSRT